jgi:hypothetical protein
LKIGAILVVMVFSIFLMPGLLTSVIPDTYAQGPAVYVGSDKCKGCHPTENKVYDKAKYAKTWKVIKMQGRTTDPACLKCHVTAYGQAGGFVSESATPYLEGKQCEDCHGPGSTHVEKPNDVEPIAEMKQFIRASDACIRCHLCAKTHKSSDSYDVY